MAKITAPTSLSSQFNIPAQLLEQLGIVDVMLDVDTKLFIDPMLLENSQHEEISLGATKSYRERFELIISLLSKSSSKGDVAWRAAEKLFNSSEISNTCLGYGTSVKGSGFGKELVANTIQTAHEIINLGIDDIGLFMVLSLNADLQQEMTTAAKHPCY